jgi:hypothetical protein
MWHHTVAGALFGVAFFIFLDGGVMLKNRYADAELTFVDTLCIILAGLGLCLFACVNVSKITGGSNDDDLAPMMGMGGDDDVDGHGAITARVLFFLSAFMMLAGMAVSVYRVVYWGNKDVYPVVKNTTAGGASAATTAPAAAAEHFAWAGYCQLVNSLISMVAAMFLLYGNWAVRRRPSD